MKSAMASNHQYPYGYQLSLLERIRLRLSKINYRLSIGLGISILVLGSIDLLVNQIMSETLAQSKLFGGVIFLLAGLQGLVWAITGEMKKTANLTYRGKWISIGGAILCVICWSATLNIILILLGII